jgi:iron complex transport system substrate-binding protein
MRPDLIVYDASLYSDQDVEKLKTLKADMFAVSANTIRGFIEEMFALGQLIGSEKTLNDYANRILVEADANSDSGATRRKVAVIMPGNGSADYIAGTKSFVADAVRTVGGEPVGPESDRFVVASPESIVALNPDVIIVPATKQNMKGAQAVATNPKYRTINAIKNNHISAIDQDVLLRRGARVDTLLKATRQVIGGAIR